MKKLSPHDVGIYIPFEYFADIGGPSTFMNNLKNFMDEHNYSYLTDVQNAKIIFFPIEFNFPCLDKIKKNSGVVIQRLDGIYYPTKHGERYKKLNEHLKKIYLEYADFVVFQSEYSRKQCFSMLGEKDETKYTIIINGVFSDIFYPSHKSHPTSPLRLITTGSFRNIDMLEPIFLSLDLLREKYQFELNIIGPITNPELARFLDYDYVVYHGEKSRTEISRLLRDSDIFIYSHLNPPCPNSVLEAIATGLPVVGFDSGAMSELCWFSKDLLAPVSNDLFQRYEDFSPNELAKKISLCIDQYSYFRKEALAHSSLYSFEQCGSKYIQVFETVLKNQSMTKKQEQYTIPKAYTNMNRIIRKITNIFRRKIKNNNNGILEDDNQTTNSDFVTSVINDLSSRILEINPKDALKLLFDLENRLYQLEGQASILYGGGLHTKHRHINYHNFFIENIPNYCRVLDVGCGNGALAADIAANVKNTIIFGIDINQDNISCANNKYAHPNITYVCGNALFDLPKDEFDIIVLSNVLEHINERVEFLQVLTNKYHPNAFLIRVPCYDRDWRVPLKEEIGVEYRLDNTHFIEYRYDELVDELLKADLFIESSKVNWGEIWAVVKPLQVHRNK